MQACSFAVVTMTCVIPHTDFDHAFLTQVAWLIIDELQGRGSDFCYIDLMERVDRYDVEVVWVAGTLEETLDQLMTDETAFMD